LADDRQRETGATVTLVEQLEADLKAAILAGDTRKRDVIRFLRAAIKNRAIEQRADLSDAEVQDIIRYQIKQRRDSIDLFRAGGRDELANEEERQIAILQPYLPQQLSEDELRAIVRVVVARANAGSARDMGRVMPVLLAEVGSRAEARTVSQLAREELDRRAAEGSAS
jgi:uncharacterized protein YqeY